MNNSNNRIEPEQKDQQSQKSPSIWRWVLTIAAIGLFIYQFSRQDFRETFEIIKNLSLLKILAALGLIFCSRLAVAARWNALLKINDPKPKFSQILKITFAGLFSSNVLPTSVGGDFVRLVMGMQIQLDPAYITSSLIMDRIVGFTGMAFLLPFGLSMLLKSPDNPFLTGSLLGFPFAIAFSDIPKKIWGWMRKFVNKIFESIKLWLKNPMYLLEALGFTFLHMAFYFSAIWIFLNSMQAEIPFFKMCAIYSLSYVISLMPISIGSLGVQELAISYFFSTLGGIPSETAYALALLIRIAFVVCSVPGVLFLPDIGKKKKTEAKTEE